MADAFDSLHTALQELLPELEEIYKDLHSHPELSMQEVRTAGIAADWLARLGYEVTRKLGGTGVVGLLCNGDGPTVMLRADMDALPVTEATGLPYASTVTARDEDGAETGVSHACGHDFHTTWLMGAARLLAEHRDAWKGSLMVVFQPGEEVGRGAQGMVDDGMGERFPKPDVILGQHVVPAAAGTVGWRSGTIMAAAHSLKVKLFGRGAHGSQPQSAIDPVIMAASTAMRLQTIVSREVSPLDSAVLTIGSLQAGTKENIIPDDATIKLNVRTYDEDVERYMLGAIRRICDAECMASNAPHAPEYTTLSTYPLTHNDAKATMRIAQVFQRRFGDKAFETAAASASEDFSVFGRSWKVPYVFWVVGGIDAEVYEKAAAAKALASLPVNHSPKFAPAIHPTLETGVATLLEAAGAWLRTDAPPP